MRWLLILGLWLVPFVSVQAAETRLRSSVVPSVGATVKVFAPLDLRVQVEGRFITSGPRWAHPASLGLRVGPYVQIHPILGLSAQYVFAEGIYPLEGPGRREHTGQVALRLASRGERFLVGNTLAADLRAYVVDEDWGFHLRTRDEVRLTGVFFPWLKLSALSEVLVQTTLPADDRLQMRAGLALHGDVELTRRKDPDQASSPRRPPPTLFWFVAARVGLHPMALYRRDRLGEDASIQHRDRGHTVDLVITPSLAGLF